ncbi:MAG: DNA topoisomerase 3, partial [Solirubrobacteraceae bacterium]
MSKTLLVAEKPSVGQDLARALPGPFKKGEGFLEGPAHVITWAVGHLVQLAEPEAYDAKYKSWRMADLPIVPERFKLEVRDERSRKQMSVVTKQLGREDVEEVVNACDAGREGELIFAYLYEKAKAKKPVKRLWLNSMTSAAMKSALASLRPAEEFELLEQAARSRSEADWIVGMNATRAATIRLRSSFDGAVSLGRVQTPTLAIVARREEEIKAFKPEPYWLVDATFVASGARVGGDPDAPAPDGERVYLGHFQAPPGSPGTTKGPRIGSEDEALAIVTACDGRPGRITKLEKKEQRERAPMLYDLTTLQREANNRYGFSARRTLSAAQRLYEEHKALTYPRTNSRYLPSDMIEEIKPIAELVGSHAEYRKGADYVSGLDVLPLGRVVNDEKVTDHHAIIPTRSAHNLEKMGSDDRRIYDMVVRRFLAVFHPEAIFENTRVETTVTPADGEGGKGHLFRTRGKLLLVPGWRGVYDEVAADTRGAETKAEAEEDEETDQQLPRLVQDEQVQTRTVESLRKETKPPRRYSDASLLGAMETAGKLVEDDELREAMKDSGIGTPATRAAIIERLITVGYIERDGRALVATEKGLNVIRLLNEHALTSPSLTGSWEQRLGKIERGEDSRKEFMGDIASFAQGTVKELDETLKDVRIPRARLGPCPVCAHEIVENRKGYSCWA